MTEQCNIVQEMMTDYINNNLSNDGIGTVIMHLSKCKRCREEMSLLIKIQKQLTTLIDNVPADIKKSAFEKISKEPSLLSDIFSAVCPFQADDILDYTFNLTSSIIKLALRQA